MSKGKVVSFANTKGGVGKTTVSGNLVWALAREFDRNVLAVDADKQASLTKWFDLADAVAFDRLQLTTARVLQSQLPRLRKQYEIIVVDCPPVQADVTAAAVTQSDLALVPVQPSPLDVLAYSELVPLLRQAEGVNPNVKIRFVVNQLARGTVLAREVVESLADTEIPMMESHVHDRQAYRRSISEGQAALVRSGPHQEEILSLAKEVLYVLELE